MIDLHTHSTCSDGSLSPKELIEKAHEIGLCAIAITDHDTVDGIEEFQNTAKLYPNLRAINGCELAVSVPNADIEILALNIKNINAFQKREVELLKIRNNANFERLEKLQKIGIEISIDDIYKNSDGSAKKVVGRPHFAKVLVEKKYAKNKQEAFDKYLSEGCVGYIPKNNPDWKSTLEFIVENGAISSIAHPIHSMLNDIELVDFLTEAKKFVLHALECYHSDHNLRQIDKYLAITEMLGLKATGGSDFHGENKKNIALGTGKGQLNIPDELLDIFD